MYATSARWPTALRASSQHRVTRLDVCRVDGTVLASLPASDGSVEVTASAQVRRSCGFTLPALPDLVPAGGGDLLSPLSGNELRPYAGFAYPDGASELVPLGVLPIRRTRVSTDGRTIVLDASDRSTTVSRNRWSAPYVIAEGTSLEEAIAGILRDRAPGLPTNLLPTDVTVPAKSYGVESEDPWADAQQLATAAGFDLYYDADGVAVLAQPSDPATAVPLTTYADDSAAIVADADKDWDASLSYNGVIAAGESADPYVPAVMAIVWDDDPDSPTYYLGQYGPYPEYITSPDWVTQDQAQAAARAQLARRRGLAQALTWSQLVDPALDAGDAVAFVNSRLAISGATVVLDSITIPWKVGALASATTRTMQAGVR